MKILCLYVEMYSYVYMCDVCSSLTSYLVFSLFLLLYYLYCPIYNYVLTVLAFDKMQIKKNINL